MPPQKNWLFWSREKHHDVAREREEKMGLCVFMGFLTSIRRRLMSQRVRENSRVAASPRTRAASSSIDAASSLNFFCGSPVHGALCAHARLRLLHASPDPRELPAAALKQLAQKGQGRSIKKGCCTPHALTSGQGSTSTPSRAAAKLMTISSSLYFQTFFTLLQSVSLCYYSVKSIFESFCSDNAVFRQLRHLGRRELTRFVARSTISGADRTFFHQSGYAFSKICKVMFFVDVGIDYILKSSLENSPMKRYWLRCESCDDFPAFIFCICHFSKLQYDFSFMNFPLTVAAVNQYFSKKWSLNRNCTVPLSSNLKMKPEDLIFFVKMRSPYHIAESPVICSLFTRLASFSSALNCIERPMTPTPLLHSLQLKYSQQSQRAASINLIHVMRCCCCRNIVQKMAHIFTFVNKTVLTNYSWAMRVLLPRRQELKVRKFIFLSASPQSDRFCTNDLHRTLA